MTKEELEKEAEEFTDSKKSFWRQGRTCIDSVKQAYLAGAEPREKRIEELIALINAERERQEKCDDVHLRKIADLEKENAELKADNDARKFAMAMSEKVEKQLREENSKLKDEWQEQVQKATDEGYARTLQTMQLTKAKEIIKIFLKYEICTLNIKDELADNIAKAKAFLKSEVEK